MRLFTRSTTLTTTRRIASLATRSQTLVHKEPISRTMTTISNPSKAGQTDAGPPDHKMVYFPQMSTSLPSKSNEFRRVLWTGLYSQVVLMNVPVGGDIGDEVHTVDQALTFTSGTGRATIAGKDQDIKAGDLVVVPAGTQHQFVNTGDKPLVLYTVYSQAEHATGTVHKTKEEGDEEEDVGGDEAPEWSRKSKKENEAAGLVREDGKYD